MGIGDKGDRRYPKRGPADLWHVLVVPLWSFVVGLIFVGWSVLLGWMTAEELLSYLLFVYVLGVVIFSIQLKGMQRSSRTKRLWVSDTEVGVNIRVSRDHLGKIVVASEMDQYWKSIYLYDTEGNEIFGVDAYPHPRWKWIRFLRKEGLPVEAEPWHVPLAFRPIRFWQILSNR